MRVAFYGGSFNPPHVGHAMVASWVRWSNLADEVFICPTASHPFGKDLLPFETRYQLCRQMCDDIRNPFLSVSDIESVVPHKVSYTYLTLKHYQSEHPDWSFRPIMGSDVLGDTSKWKYWAELEKEFPPIFVGREGYPTQESPTFPNISSTLIRDRVRAAEPIHGLVTSGVEAIIKRERLYR